MINKHALRNAMKRERVWKVVASFDGCKVTAKQIQALLEVPICEAQIARWIRRFIAEGLLEAVERRSDPRGNLIKVKQPILTTLANRNIDQKRKEAKHDH